METSYRNSSMMPLACESDPAARALDLAHQFVLISHNCCYWLATFAVGLSLKRVYNVIKGSFNLVFKKFFQESFSILDSGIYRIISSRRGSQSDEDSCSLHSQTLSEDERLKEFTSQQEEDQPDQCFSSHGNEGNECVFCWLQMWSSYFLWLLFAKIILCIEFSIRC